MALPTDPKLTKLRILHERLMRELKPAVEEAEQRFLSLRRDLWEAEAEYNGKVMERAKELGYCSVCELPLTECEGHIWMAGEGNKG